MIVSIKKGDKEIFSAEKREQQKNEKMVKQMVLFEIQRAMFILPGLIKERAKNNPNIKIYTDENIKVEHILKYGTQGMETLKEGVFIANSQLVDFERYIAQSLFTDEAADMVGRINYYMYKSKERIKGSNAMELADYAEVFLISPKRNIKIVINCINTNTKEIGSCLIVNVKQ